MVGSGRSPADPFARGTGQRASALPPYFLLAQPSMLGYTYLNLKGSRMKLEKRKPSGREKDEASIELLSQLREKLHSGDISTARRAAFNLSWMQEDGLDILKEALFGDFPRTAKKAAAYGLRNMHGRMKKMALELLTKGLKRPDRVTKEACEKAMQLIEGKVPPKGRFTRKRKPRKFNIKEIPSTRRTRGSAPHRGTRTNR